MKPVVVTLFLAILFITLLAFRQSSSLEASMARGKVIFNANCATCHMQDGKGIEGVYPPLAQSDYLMADKKRAIQQVLEGANGAMTVNGITYNGFMAGFNLNDQEVSDVLNYIRNSWGNKGDAILPADVKQTR